MTIGFLVVTLVVFVGGFLDDINGFLDRQIQRVRKAHTRTTSPSREHKAQSRGSSYSRTDWGGVGVYVVYSYC